MDCTSRFPAPTLCKVSSVTPDKLLSNYENSWSAPFLYFISFFSILPTYIIKPLRDEADVGRPLLLVLLHPGLPEELPGKKDFKVHQGIKLISLTRSGLKTKSSDQKMSSALLFQGHSMY